MRNREAVVVVGLCLLAALRVFVFSAAYPLFNNVDEESHVDLVLRYALGDWPRQADEPFRADSGKLFALYGTREYLVSPEEFPDGKIPPPPWSKGLEQARRDTAWGGRVWSERINHEAHSPPVYYLVAGAWYRIGGGLGLDEGGRLYWIRFLNVPLAMLLVWIGYRFAREAAPGRRDLRIGVPLMLALMPQDVFYTVNSDVLSPVLVGAAALMLWRWYRSDAAVPLRAIALGLLVAASFLVKFTNAPIALILAAAAALKLRRLSRAGARPALLASSATPCIAAALPVAAFFARNWFRLGDLTGTASKVDALGWSLQAPGKILLHPIFSFSGLWTFWGGVMETFWRGELTWHLEHVGMPAVDAFLSVSTLVLLLAAAAELVRRRGELTGAERSIEAISWAAVGLSLAGLAALSVAFDFGTSHYPSAENPYFTSGRLILGVAVPFVYLYVRGLAALVRPWAGTTGALAMLVLVGLGLGIQEIVLNAHLLSNPYNYFHLP